MRTRRSPRTGPTTPSNKNEPNDVGDDNPGEAERHDNRGPGSLNSGPGNAEDRGDDGATQADDSGSGGSGHR